MNSPSTADFSVYQLTQDTVAPSLSFSVDPVTLKSLVGTLIDVLVEERIPAMLWVKQPPKDGWQAELERYRQQDNVPQTIYLCSGVEEDLVAGTEGVGQVAGVNRDSHVFPVRLVAGSKLKREYFLIVACERFSCLVVAYLPESAAIATGETRSLVAVCSFEQRVIQRVLTEMRGAIAAADTTPQGLLKRWQTRFPQLSSSDEKAVLTQLLVKQIQRSEEMLHLPPNGDSPGVGNPVPISSVGADKLDDKDEFLKRVALELRTPLTNMKTALKLLDAAQLKPPQRQRYMQLLNTECDRQTSLITGVLALVELEGETQPAVMRSVQLLDVVPGVVSTYHPIAQEKGIKLDCTIPDGLPSVSCLENWLRQIVINLLHNSLKFTPVGGKVRVRGTLQGDYVQLEFDDTGVGIAPSEIPIIFDCFYRGRTTTGENTGAGLGLTIVQRLLLRCGGSISVTSQLGEGSSFKVLLPIASPASSERNSQ